MTTTQLNEALAKAGYVPRNVELQLAIAKFQNNGGEYGVALAMLNAAYGRGGEGHSGPARDGLTPTADASPRHDDDAGPYRRSEEAKDDLPASSSPKRSPGRRNPADEATAGVPGAASRSKPGHARRGAAVTARLSQRRMLSLFDSTTLPDGRTLREIRWSEIPGLATRYRRLSRVLMAIHGTGVPADPNATIDNIVSEDGLKSIIDAVEKFNDIH